MRKIRNIRNALFCTEIYVIGPTIEIYNGCFEPRRWLFYIRYEATVRGKRPRPITYPLTGRVGVSLAQVEKRMDLFNIIENSVKNCSNEILR